MAVIKFSTVTKEAILTQVKNAIDGGSGAGTIKLYTGTIPATPETAISSQVLLGTLTFSDPCGVVGTPTAGALTFSAITQDSSADATGTATWARIADSSGTTVVDINVTVTGGGGALQLNTTSIVAGGPIIISAFVLSVA